MLQIESKQQNEDKIEENYGFKFGTTMNNRWMNIHFKLWNTFVTTEIVNWVYVLTKTV